MVRVESIRVVGRALSILSLALAICILSPKRASSWPWAIVHQITDAIYCYNCRDSFHLDGMRFEVVFIISYVT